MEYKDLPKNPVAVTLALIGCRWKIMIISELLSGTKRFSEIKKSLKGITQKVLTSKLRELEKDQMIIREQIGNRVEYTLSDTGYSLHPVINSISEWGRDYKKYKKLIDSTMNKNV